LPRNLHLVIIPRVYPHFYFLLRFLIPYYIHTEILPKETWFPVIIALLVLSSI